jgi:hypothetical protein
MTGRGATVNRDRLQKKVAIFALPFKRTAFGWQSLLVKIGEKEHSFWVRFAHARHFFL